MSSRSTNDGTYWVEDDTYYEYKDFFDSEKNRQSIPVRFPEEKQKDIITWIDQWRKVKELDFSLEHEHFFLEGRHLDDISNELISRARSEILVVNPFLSSCDLSSTLRAAKGGIQAILITRPPEDKNKQRYHRFLRRDGHNDSLPILTIGSLDIFWLCFAGNSPHCSYCIL